MNLIDLVARTASREELVELLRATEEQRQKAHTLATDLWPCAIAHMAANNGSGDAQAWHPEHRELHDRAKALLG